MIQDQLVDYINAQMKIGVARDTIKNTLVSAGWQTADVEDTLKKVESQKASTASPIGQASAPAAGPQILKVSDFVSASPAPQSTKDISPRSPMTGPATSPKAGFSDATVTSKTSTTSVSMQYPAAKPSTSRTTLIVGIILVLIILAVGGVAGFLYTQNNSLSGQLTTLQSQSSGVASQVSALQAQMAASTTALAAQISSLTAEDQELQNELSFYAVPPNGTSTAGSALTISGLVAGGGKAPYAITAMYGGKIYVGNSKDPSVVAALAPLVGSTTTQQFAGTYVPGSDTMTLAAVNGTALQ